MKKTLGHISAAVGIAIMGCACASDAGHVQQKSVEVVDMTDGRMPIPQPFSDLQEIQKEVAYLDEKKEYKIAYNLFDEYINQNYSLENIQYALDHAEKHLLLLSTQNVLQAKSEFVIPKDPTLWEIIRNRLALSAANIVTLGPMSLIFVCITEYDTWNKLSTADKLNYQRATEQKFPCISKEQALETVNQYNILKASLKKLLITLEKSYPKSASEQEKSEYFAVRNRAEKLKDQAIEQRCVFISYNIISPALAEASKGLYIATFKWLGLDDKEKLKDAAIQMCHSFHKEWLVTAKEDVRFQSSDVIKRFKGEVGKEEWEELETITTMADSNDPSKRWGANAWWNE